MAANDISTLEFKADRQLAKLELAKAKREGRIVAVDGTVTGDIDSTKPYYRDRNQYDIAQLPTVYSTSSNLTSEVVDNPNSSGLVYGRPWV